MTVTKLTILSTGLPSKLNQNSTFLLIYSFFYFGLREHLLSLAASIKPLLCIMDFPKPLDFQLWHVLFMKYRITEKNCKPFGECFW